ncbi:MAG: hypothetical protein IT218_02610 [Ignavibacteria bacterium]|nr:hypothetical protein [Ignavibacteria bacterium]
MKYAVAALCAIVGLCLLGVHANSQEVHPTCHPCVYPDTLQPSGLPWLNKTIGIGGGCAVQISYSTARCMPEGCHVLRIDRMSFIGEGCKKYCPWDLYALVIGTALTENTLELALDSTAERQCLWLVQPKCWRRLSGFDSCFYSANYYERFMPCDMYECCFAKLILVRDACNKWSFADVDTSVIASYLGSETFEDQMDEEVCANCEAETLPLPNPDAPSECPDDHRCYWSCHQDIAKRFLTLQRVFR